MTEKKTKLSLGTKASIAGGITGTLGVIALYAVTAVMLISVLGFWGGVVWVWFALYTLRAVLPVVGKVSVAVLTDSWPTDLVEAKTRLAEYSAK